MGSTMHQISNKNTSQNSKLDFKEPIDDGKKCELPTRMMLVKTYLKHDILKILDPAELVKIFKSLITADSKFAMFVV